MQQFGGKSAKKSSSDSKRHFTVVMGDKEHGLYVSSTPSSAARKAVTKLCTANKSKKVEFSIREITQGSKKKTYGPYEGHIEKLKEPIELKGRVIKYKPVAKLSGKKGVMKGGLFGLKPMDFTVNFLKRGNNDGDPTYKYDSSFFGKDKLFFGPTFKFTEKNGETWSTREYFPILLFSDGSSSLLSNEDFKIYPYKNLDIMSEMINLSEKKFTIPNRNKNFSEEINNLLDLLHLSKFLHGQSIKLSIRSFLQNDLTLEDFKIYDHPIRKSKNHYKYIKNYLERNILFFGTEDNIFLSINNIDYYPFVLLCGSEGYTILVFEKIDNEYKLSSYNYNTQEEYLTQKKFFKELITIERWKEENNKTSVWGENFHKCILSILSIKESNYRAKSSVLYGN